MTLQVIKLTLFLRTCILYKHHSQTHPEKEVNKSYYNQVVNNNHAVMGIHFSGELCFKINYCMNETSTVIAHRMYPQQKESRI